MFIRNELKIHLTLKNGSILSYHFNNTKWGNNNSTFSVVWDCTCVDTFAGVHLNRSAMEAGIAANNAKERKRRKCAALAEAHQFEPIAVETMGVYGESTGVIIKAIGRRLVEATGDPREANWFRQNLAIAIQRGNAFSILSAGQERF